MEDKNYQIKIKEKHINISNFSEIIDFSPTQIIIRCDKNIIKFEGKELVISKMLEEEILITGKLVCIRIN